MKHITQKNVLRVLVLSQVLLLAACATPGAERGAVADAYRTGVTFDHTPASSLGGTIFKMPSSSI